MGGWRATACTSSGKRQQIGALHRTHVGRVLLPKAMCAYRHRHIIMLNSFKGSSLFAALVYVALSIMLRRKTGCLTRCHHLMFSSSVPGQQDSPWHMNCF